MYICQIELRYARWRVMRIYVIANKVRKHARKCNDYRFLLKTPETLKRDRERYVNIQQVRTFEFSSWIIIKRD